VFPDAPAWIQALVLGIVQGLTEFIPVSSSGHLVLVPALAGWERHGLAFDVALHVGTLVALLVFYRADLWGMTRALIVRTPSAERAFYRRLVVLLILGSLPVAIVGLTLRGAVESVFAAPSTAAGLLLVTAAVLVGGERIADRRDVRRRTDQVIASPRGSQAGSARHTDEALPSAIDGPAADALPSAIDGPAADAVRGVELDVLSWRQALLVGVAQSLALLPGLSRAGLTISAGVAAGLSRTAATRFAFLLGLPAIAGAAVVSIPDVDDLSTISGTELAVGILAAAVSGYVAIAFLVRLVSRIGIDRFAWYLVPLSAVSLLVLR
jgi:undecaprenyl-diphosphatase